MMLKWPWILCPFIIHFMSENLFKTNRLPVARLKHLMDPSTDLFIYFIKCRTCYEYIFKCILLFAYLYHQIIYFAACGDSFQQAHI